jgi:hypothetical protein
LQEHNRLLHEIIERKQRALNTLLTVRSQPEHRRSIPAAVQADVEKQLDTRADGELDELLEMLERLEDGKASSCRLFMLWWNAQPNIAARGTVAQPLLESAWENSLGMRFVPLGNVQFGVWPVRVQDFRAFVVDTGHDADTGLFSLVGGKWVQQGDTWKSPGFAQGSTHPVVGVSWEDASAFCTWLTSRERACGHVSAAACYRLPSDAEWSNAVGQAKYPWGDQWPVPAGAGHYSSADAQRGGTSPVGTYAPNAKGIFDLGGNVWEWCDGWYAKEMNPPEVRRKYEFTNDDGGGGAYRFMRGASWFNHQEWQLLSAYRNTGKVPNVRFANVGFRCLLEFGRSNAETGFRP